MKRSSELWQQAERYRRLKRQISDPRALQAICELAGESEMTAAALEERQLIRQRLRIWVARGCLEGRDVEHWLMAERQLVGDARHVRRESLSNSLRGIIAKV
jgi:hypothetical protein